MQTVMLIAESVNFECCRPPTVVWYFGTDLPQSRCGGAVRMMQISVLRLWTSQNMLGSGRHGGKRCSLIVVGEDGSLVRKAAVNPDEWGGMQKPGPNGFFTVLLVLLWWRMESGATCIWRAVVEEVMWCVKHMVGGSVSGPQVASGASM